MLGTTGFTDTASALDLVAHIIQVALTPVFLLNGIATLLNVFSTRLARVSDRLDQLTVRIAAADQPTESLSLQLAHLRRRSHTLDIAVVLGGVGGAATCGAVLTLFVGAVQQAATASVLFALFGLAVSCTIGALAAYTTEMMMASRGVRKSVHHHFLWYHRRQA